MFGQVLNIAKTILKRNRTNDFDIDLNYDKISTYTDKTKGNKLDLQNRAYLP